jgi:hypothetical protein
MQTEFAAAGSPAFIRTREQFVGLQRPRGSDMGAHGARHRVCSVAAVFRLSVLRDRERVLSDFGIFR